MKYSHDYSKLKRKTYTTIRRYPKGKVGDIVLEKYPSGQHYAKITSRTRITLHRIGAWVLMRDTDKRTRKECYDLFQSFYKKPIDFRKDKFYLYYLTKTEQKQNGN